MPLRRAGLIVGVVLAGPEQGHPVRPLRRAFRRFHEAGLGVNAGHDLNQENLSLFISAIPAIAEVSIGHALISEALDDGLADTVRAYVDILREANPK